jgi:hypothetical protein
LLVWSVEEERGDEEDNGGKGAEFILARTEDIPKAM